VYYNTNLSGEGGGGGGSLQVVLSMLSVFLQMSSNLSFRFAETFIDLRTSAIVLKKQANNFGVKTILTVEISKKVQRCDSLPLQLSSFWPAMLW